MARLVEGGPRSFPLSIRDWYGNMIRQSAMLDWLEAGGGIKLLDCREMENRCVGVERALGLEVVNILR